MFNPGDSVPSEGLDDWCPDQFLPDQRPSTHQRGQSWHAGDQAVTPRISLFDLADQISAWEGDDDEQLLGLITAGRPPSPHSSSISGFTDDSAMETTRDLNCFDPFAQENDLSFLQDDVTFQQDAPNCDNAATVGWPLGLRSCSNPQLDIADTEQSALGPYANQLGTWGENQQTAIFNVGFQPQPSEGGAVVDPGAGFFPLPAAQTVYSNPPSVELWPWANAPTPLGDMQPYAQSQNYCPSRLPSSCPAPPMQGCFGFAPAPAQSPFLAAGSGRAFPMATTSNFYSMDNETRATFGDPPRFEPANITRPAPASFAPLTLEQPDEMEIKMPKSTTGRTPFTQNKRRQASSTHLSNEYLAWCASQPQEEKPEKPKPRSRSGHKAKQRTAAAGATQKPRSYTPYPSTESLKEVVVAEFGEDWDQQKPRRSGSGKKAKTNEDPPGAAEQAWLSGPMDLATNAVPVGVAGAGTAGPTEEASLASSVDESGLAGPVDEASLTNPVDGSGLAGPVDETGHKNPVGESGLAGPGGKKKHTN